jgi:TPR repeat protein
MAQGKIEEAITAQFPNAAKNDPHALYLMAVIHLSPASNHFNPKKGIALLERAVFQNYGPALDELAGLYLAGEGVEKNEAKALHYYTQASHLGYGPSQFNCGIMYKEGQGTEKNLEKAYLYLSLASLNRKDLEDVTINAAQYRDEIVPLLTPTQRQDVLRLVNDLTLPVEPSKTKTVTP